MNDRNEEDEIEDIKEIIEAPDDQKPAKKLSFITKFFLFAFTVLLVFHFATNWLSTEKINEQANQLSELNKEISNLQLKNQELSVKVKTIESELGKAKTNLEFVDSDRVKKASEIEELKQILSMLKKNIPEGSKLVIERLEKKLESWEDYYKTLDETLKNRPAK